MDVVMDLIGLLRRRFAAPAAAISWFLVCGQSLARSYLGRSILNRRVSSSMLGGFDGRTSKGDQLCQRECSPPPTLFLPTPGSPRWSMALQVVSLMYRR